MENAVIYARYSSHNQTENSIEAQVEAAKSFAKKHSYNIIRVYADRAKTGTNDNREEFQQMLKDSDSHSFTVIIVWKVDRFGRNREEIALNKYRCKKNGVRVEYVAENISDGPEGVILEAVLEGFAEYYSRQLSQNIKRGLHNKAKKGVYTGGRVPYGYKIVDGKYNVDENQAKKIKEVFKLFNSGLNYMDVQRQTGISYFNVKTYVRAEHYATGIMTRCGQEIKVEPIISLEEYNKAHTRAMNYTRRVKKDKYLLTGKLFCGFCGAKYKGCGNKNDKYNYYRSSCHCCKKRIRRDDIDHDILENIYNIIQSDENIQKLTDKVYEKIKQRVKNINNPAKKEKLLSRKQNLLQLVEDGALPYEDLRERLVQLDAELLSCDSGTSSAPIINRSDVEDYIKQVKGLINNKVALIETFINKIEVMPNGTYKITYEPENIFGSN